MYAAVCGGGGGTNASAKANVIGSHGARVAGPRAERCADDLAVLGVKKVHWPFTIDAMRKRPIVGTHGVAAMYRRQLRHHKQASALVGPDGCPTLIGEFGIPYAA